MHFSKLFYISHTYNSYTNLYIVHLYVYISHPILNTSETCLPGVSVWLSAIKMVLSVKLMQCKDSLYIIFHILTVQPVEMKGLSLLSL